MLRSSTGTADAERTCRDDSDKPSHLMVRCVRHLLCSFWLPTVCVLRACSVFAAGGEAKGGRGGRGRERGEEEGARWSRMNHISSDSAGFKTRSRTTKFVAKPRPRRGGMRQQRGTWKVSTHLLPRITHRTSREHTSCRFSRVFFNVRTVRALYPI